MIRFVWLLFFVSSIANAQLHVLFMGDSLTEGYGVSREKAFPSLVKDKIENEKLLDFPVKITNGSISGSTSANAPSRLKWFLKAKPNILILALGANDGLRGINVESSSGHLAETIALAKKNNVRVILTGMLMPPNYGADYRKKFESMYQKLQKKYELDFIPFLLDGVAGVKELNQSDGIHPNEKGHEVIAKNVLKVLLPILKEEHKKLKVKNNDAA